ncbi:hypothetical protein L484_023930 [Morus notabilis]|uniref:ABC transporter domain-containing protein n=1 Tax=Morus notabilis TaxID=981085 RepID=W9RNS4_9ROSA|nr:hypothetical protein L484_023930 [Morus notabilis]
MEDNNVQKLPQQNDDVEEEDSTAHKVIDVDDDDTKNFESRPFSFVLGFNNLSYSVKLRQKLTFASLLTRTTKPVTKTILDDISGEVRDGEMLALLGASGSGKSTLLDALANRIAKESLKGTLTLNGEAMDARLSKSITAYVMQDDLLYPMLTVEETLMFAAEFRLTRTIGESKKKERVQALIDQLGLRNVAKTIIGDQGR